MAHLQPLPLEEIQELKPFLATAEFVLGFTPNSLLTWARRPKILEGFSALSKATFAPPGTINSELKMMVAYTSNVSAECGYCEAHSFIPGIYMIEKQRSVVLWCGSLGFRHMPIQRHGRSNILPAS